MPMQLVFKRSKSFVHEDEGTKSFLAQANPSQSIAVPFWVALTPTFKYGIKDGSIINLTPADQMPGYKAALPAPVIVEKPTEPEAEVELSEEDKLKAEIAAKDDAEGAEQGPDDKPKAPFGGQPMTPVQPAPKVGGITASVGRTKK